MSSPADILKALVAVLRQERERRGMNYEQFSAASGLHRTTLGLYDRGERSPTVEAALNMARALGLPLSELLRKAESKVAGQNVPGSYLRRREVPLANFRNAERLRAVTGLSVDSVRRGMLDCYQALDTIDDQLAAHGAEPISRLIELANLSSMLGNLLGAGLAEASNGLYERNKPRAYPDLLSQTPNCSDLEINIALEKNKPKGHLPKAGNHILFRYVLCDDSGAFKKGRSFRGTRVFVWEVKTGMITEDDFAISNTEGDSGKTAVIKTPVFNAMPLIYFDSELLPYAAKTGKYPGFN